VIGIGERGHAGVASDATGQREEGDSGGAGGSVAGKGTEEKWRGRRRGGPDEERKSIGDVETDSQPSPLPEGKGKTTMWTRRTAE
jgi:hypothetical protein